MAQNDNCPVAGTRCDPIMVVEALEAPETRSTAIMRWHARASRDGMTTVHWTFEDRQNVRHIKMPSATRRARPPTDTPNISIHKSSFFRVSQLVNGRMQLHAYIALGFAALAAAQSSSTESSDRHSVTDSRSSTRDHSTEHSMTDSVSSTKTHSSEHAAADSKSSSKTHSSDHSSKSTESARHSSSSASSGFAAATDVPLLFAGGALGAAALGFLA